MKHHRLLFFVALVLLIIALATNAASHARGEANQIVSRTPTPPATYTPYPTATARPTYTPYPTATDRPTYTPYPPADTATPEPEPEPEPGPVVDRWYLPIIIGQPAPCDHPWCGWVR